MSEPLQRSVLRTYRQDGSVDSSWDRSGEIAERLTSIGIHYERWPTDPTVDGSTHHDQILAHYDTEIQRINEKFGMSNVDVMSVTPDFASDPEERAAVRKKFLGEHTHSEDEVRYFVDGGAIFYFHCRSGVHSLIGTRGDLVGIPAGTKHWFDMGESPSFTAIRFFKSEDGWVANYTGDPHVDRYPLMPSIV